MIKRVAQRIRFWWISGRPKTLPAAVAPVLVGGALAYADGCWLPSVWVATLLSAVLIQIGTNLANDYFDFIKGVDNADRVGPARPAVAGLVTPRQLAWAAAVSFGLSALLGLYLVIVGGWPIMVIGLLCIASGVLYTAGSHSLADLGWGDLFVLIFFGPVATAGTYYLQAGRLTPVALLAGWGLGLLSTAILTVNNVRDFYTDRDAGRRTLVVRFGRAFGRAEYAVSLIAGCLLPGLLVAVAGGHYAGLMALATLVGAGVLIRRMYRDPDPERMNKMLAQTGKLLMLYSVLFCVGWLL